MKRSAPVKKLLSKKGFTTVELMIASAVFGTVLLLVASGLIHVGKLYYKGITMSRTQEAARNVMQEVSDNLKFTSGNIRYTSDETPAQPSDLEDDPDSDGNPTVVCMGGVKYIFELNERFSGTSTPYTTAHGLKRVYMSPSAACTYNGASDDAIATQLLSSDMWLLDFDICPGGNELCDVNITLAYGVDREVFTDDPDDPDENGDPSTRICRGIIHGTQFCTVTNLTTTVIKRVRE